MERNSDTEIPEWHQPEGAHDAYREGAFVRYEGKIWVSYYILNVWRPGEAGWSEIRV